MGWTHYWERGTELPKERFAKAAEDCRKVLGALGVPLADQRGGGMPTLSREQITFNGVGGEACEPFVVRMLETPRRRRNKTYCYCKTERLPYDLCVQVALIVLKHHLNEAISVSSDGRDEDWEQAREVCRAHLGYGADFTLREG